MQVNAEWRTTNQIKICVLPLYTPDLLHGLQVPTTTLVQAVSDCYFHNSFHYLVSVNIFCINILEFINNFTDVFHLPLLIHLCITVKPT
jgi:hypothetical protein